MMTAAVTATARTVQEPTVKKLEGGGRAVQHWDLPTEEAFLEEFLTYIFSKYWDQVVFGPIIEGAAYELTCPREPSRIRNFDIGDNKDTPRDPTPPELAKRRRPSKAQIFCRLDKDGAPLSWDFEMENGHGEPMISIFFANPFLLAGDKIAIQRKPRSEPEQILKPIHGPQHGAGRTQARIMLRRLAREMGEDRLAPWKTLYDRAAAEDEESATPE